MSIDEVEIYHTPSGLGRAAIVRRSDGCFCIYKWIKLPVGYLPDVFVDSASANWSEAEISVNDLYADKEPLIGIYGTVDDARRELRTLSGFVDAFLVNRA
jgi:hypothetical protein